jgi:hypothetical protein
VPAAAARGEENISIIVAPIFEGFRLDSLGSPAAAAQQFLSTIAPQGSDRTATLISAEQRCAGRARDMLCAVARHLTP